MKLRTLLTRRALLLPAIALSSTALAFSGCGSSSSDKPTGSTKASDPSKVAPADATIYAEVTVSPTGKTKADLDAVLQKIVGDTNIGEKLIEAIKKDGGTTSDANYNDDIKPWLGNKIGLYVGDMAGPQPEIVGIFALKDVEKAKKFNEDESKGFSESRNYKGIDYRLDPSDDTVVAIVSDATILGTETGFKAIVDGRSGAKLADDTDYQKSIAKLPANPLGLLYTNGKLGEQLSKFPEIGREEAIINQISSNAVFKNPIGFAITADANTIKLSGFASTNDKIKLNEDQVEQLPGDAWIAFAAADYGKQIKDGLKNSAAATELAVIEQQIKQSTGLDLNKDLLDWIGDLSVYAAGTNVASINGALVIKTKDEATTKKTIAKLLAKLKPLTAASGASVTKIEGGFRLTAATLPVPIDIADRDGKFIIAVGDKAIDKASSSSDTLGDNSQFKAAKEQLGKDSSTSFYLDFAQMLQLVEGVGGGADPDYQKAKPYLDKFSYVIVGEGSDGDKETSFTFAIGLK